MALFTSKLEKRLWIYVLTVVTIIYSGLFFGQPLIKILGAQNLQALLFLMGMLLVGLVVVIYGVPIRPQKLGLVTLIGFSTMLMMLFLRLGLTERSHLIEYGVLTVFIHRALVERTKHQSNSAIVHWLTLLLAFAVSVFDEWAQKFIPYRVFDLQDIIFNALAISMCLAFIILLKWIKIK